MSTLLTAEERDEEMLRDIEARVKEVSGLMIQRTNRQQADKRVSETSQRAEEHRGNTESVYHIVQEGHVPTTMHTRANLELCEALKERIKLGGYAMDLQDSLHRLSERQVEVLKRKLTRCRY